MEGKMKMRVFWGLWCFFMVQSVYAVGTAPAVSTNVKSATRVKKEIVGDPYLTRLDSILEYIDQTTVKGLGDPQPLRREQEKWLKKRPRNWQKRHRACEKRIRALLARPVYFKSVMQDFFKTQAPLFAQLISDLPLDEKFVTKQDNPLFFLIPYLVETAIKRDKIELPPTIRNAQRPTDQSWASALIQFPSETYLFFYCHNIGAYNCHYTAWLITPQEDSFAVRLLDIPEYDAAKQTLTKEQSLGGYIRFDPQSQLVENYFKGIGYGGFSTRRFFRLQDNRLILVKQLDTKDNLDENYQLQGTDEDWVLVYEEKGA